MIKPRKRIPSNLNASTCCAVKLNNSITHYGLLSVLIAVVFFGSPANAQSVVTTTFGVGPITKVQCTNKNTEQVVESKNIAGRSWNCSDLGLLATPGDTVRLQLTGLAASQSELGGVVWGLTNIKSIKCKNKTQSQSVTIVPSTPKWSCTVAGLSVTSGDTIKLQIEGIVDQSTHTIPGPPADLTAFSDSGSIRLSWTNVPGADFYRVYTGTTPGLTIRNAQMSFDVFTSPFTHMGLVNGLTYYYIVTSISTLGESAASIVSSASPAALPFDHSSSSAQCVSCHDGVVSIGKFPLHIPSTQICDACHTTTTWLNAVVSHLQVNGACDSCHDGVIAGGKPGIHISTSNKCDACHSTNTWIVGIVNHQEILGSCDLCHNGIAAIGKPPVHINTVAQCNVCHSTSAWLPAI